MSRKNLVVGLVGLAVVGLAGWLAVYGPAPRFTCVGEVAVDGNEAPVEWHGEAQPGMTLEEARRRAADGSCAVLCNELHPSQAGQANPELDLQLAENVENCRARCGRDANLSCSEWTDWVGRDWIRR